MRKRIVWLASVSVLTAAALVGPPAMAKRSPTVEIGSFTGAYLSARVAETDNDLDSAIAYYKRALDFDPDNQQLQQSLMLALISIGRFDEALPYAEKLKKVPDVERFSRVALAADAIRKKQYLPAETLLKLSLESDLDKLISNLLTAWVKQGENKGAEALSDLDALDGPEWYELFKTYHRALIAEAAGMADDADTSYRATIDNAAAGSAAPETWLRAAESYAGFLARKGDKAKAVEILDKADAFAPGRLPLISLRAQDRQGARGFYP